MPKLSIITVFVYLCLTSVFGQRVDITKQKDEVVRLHNAFRKVQRSSDMNKLEWSDALATKAQTFVDKCILQPPLGATPWAGQNIDGTPNKFHDDNPLLTADSLVSTAIETWYAEKFSWTYGALDCHDSCSYTQMVWAKATQVGCAAARCAALSGLEEVIRNSWFVVCYYDPPASRTGLPFDIGKPCSKCNKTDTICQDGLCAKRPPPPPTPAPTPPPPPPPPPPPQPMDMVNGILTFENTNNNLNRRFILDQQVAYNQIRTQQWQPTNQIPPVNGITPPPNQMPPQNQVSNQNVGFNDHQVPVNSNNFANNKNNNNNQMPSSSNTFIKHNPIPSNTNNFATTNVNQNPGNSNDLNSFASSTNNQITVQSNSFVNNNNRQVQPTSNVNQIPINPNNFNRGNNNQINGQQTAIGNNVMDPNSNHQKKQTRLVQWRQFATGRPQNWLVPKSKVSGSSVMPHNQRVSTISPNHRPNSFNDLSLDSILTSKNMFSGNSGSNVNNWSTRPSSFDNKAITRRNNNFTPQWTTNSFASSQSGNIQNQNSVSQLKQINPNQLNGDIKHSLGDNSMNNQVFNNGFANNPNGNSNSKAFQNKLRRKNNASPNNIIQPNIPPSSAPNTGSTSDKISSTNSIIQSATRPPLSTLNKRNVQRNNNQTEISSNNPTKKTPRHKENVAVKKGRLEVSLKRTSFSARQRPGMIKFQFKTVPKTVMKPDSQSNKTSIIPTSSTTNITSNMTRRSPLPMHPRRGLPNSRRRNMQSQGFQNQGPQNIQNKQTISKLNSPNSKLNLPSGRNSISTTNAQHSYKNVKNGQSSSLSTSMNIQQQNNPSQQQNQLGQQQYVPPQSRSQNHRQQKNSQLPVPSMNAQNQMQSLSSQNQGRPSMQSMNSQNQVQSSMRSMNSQNQQQPSMNRLPQTQQASSQQQQQQQQQQFVPRQNQQFQSQQNMQTQQGNSNNNMQQFQQQQQQQQMAPSQNNQQSTGSQPKDIGGIKIPDKADVYIYVHHREETPSQELNFNNAQNNLPTQNFNTQIQGNMQQPSYSQVASSSSQNQLMTSQQNQFQQQQQNTASFQGTSSFQNKRANSFQQNLNQQQQPNTLQSSQSQVISNINLGQMRTAPPSLSNQQSNGQQLGSPMFNNQRSSFQQNNQQSLASNTNTRMSSNFRPNGNQVSSNSFTGQSGLSPMSSNGNKFVTGTSTKNIQNGNQFIPSNPANNINRNSNQFGSANPSNNLVPNSNQFTSGSPSNNNQFRSNNPTNNIIPNSNQFGSANPSNAIVPNNNQFGSGSPTNNMIPKSNQFGSGSPTNNMIPNGNQFGSVSPSNNMIPNGNQFGSGSPSSNMISNGNQYRTPSPTNNNIQNSNQFATRNPSNTVMQNGNQFGTINPNNMNQNSFQPRKVNPSSNMQMNSNIGPANPNQMASSNPNYMAQQSGFTNGNTNPNSFQPNNVQNGQFTGQLPQTNTNVQQSGIPYTSPTNQQFTQGNPSQQQPQPVGPCQDNDVNCKVWTNYCNSTNNYVRDNCKLTCNNCHLIQVPSSNHQASFTNPAASSAMQNQGSFNVGINTPVVGQQQAAFPSNQQTANVNTGYTQSPYSWQKIENNHVQPTNHPFLNPGQSANGGHTFQHPNQFNGNQQYFQNPAAMYNAHYQTTPVYNPAFSTAPWNAQQESVSNNARLFQTGQIDATPARGSAPVTQAPPQANTAAPTTQLPIATTQAAAAVTTLAASANSNCYDRDIQCSQWTSFCNSAFVKKSCVKSCTNCV